MSDFEYSNDQSDYNYLQASQKCMRCRGYLFGWDEIVADPQYRHCDSHARCVELEDNLSNVADAKVDTPPLDELDQTNLSKENASMTEKTPTPTDYAE